MPAKGFKVRATGSPARIVKGLSFRCWHIGILRYEWRSEDGRCEVRKTNGGVTYVANVDGAAILNKSDKPKLFRMWITAAREAVDKARETAP